MAEHELTARDAAILAVANSVGMPASVGANTLVLFALALRASEPSQQVAQPTAQECDVANRLLDMLMREAHGTTKWPEHWMAVREQLIGAIRAAGVGEVLRG